MQIVHVVIIAIELGDFNWKKFPDKNPIFFLEKIKNILGCDCNWTSSTGFYMWEVPAETFTEAMEASLREYLI